VKNKGKEGQNTVSLFFSKEEGGREQSYPKEVSRCLLDVEG
jgi:hypothetical protein